MQIELDQPPPHWLTREKEIEFSITLLTVRWPRWQHPRQRWAEQTDAIARTTVRDASPSVPLTGGVRVDKPEERDLQDQEIYCRA